MQQLMASDKGASLLTVPIHRMIDELELEIRNQKQEELQRLMEEDDDIIGLDEDPTSSSNERLWVDKYRPKKYTDLMGDEVSPHVHVASLVTVRLQQDQEQDAEKMLSYLL
jgi:chromosome transmission fidelity protein 18